MEGVLPASLIPSESAATRPRVELRYRRGWQEERLSAGEIDVLGSHLTELLGELLQLTYAQNDPE
jgi:hypothetical protein